MGGDDQDLDFGHTCHRGVGWRSFLARPFSVDSLLLGKSEKAEPDARANAARCHASCWRTSRAIERRGSSLTLGKVGRVSVSHQFVAASMTSIPRLQEWYRSRCNGVWEHSYGVKVETLDNPGWKLVIDVVGTPLETATFESVRREAGEHDWIVCRVEEGQFRGYSDVGKLEDLVAIFLQWSAQNG